MAQKKIPLKNIKAKNIPEKKVKVSRNLQKAARNRKNAAPPKRTGGAKEFFKLLFSTPIRQLLLLIIVIILLAVFWESVEAFYKDLMIQFGWGLLFFGFILASVFTLWTAKRLSWLINYWNRWIGCLLLLLAAWGLISTFDYAGEILTKGPGGLFGRSLVNYPDDAIIYILRIIGLVIIGTIFIIPIQTLTGIKTSYEWIVRKFRREPSVPQETRPERVMSGGPEHRTLTPLQPAQKPPLQKDFDIPTVAPEVVSAQKKLEEMARRAEALRPSSDRISEPAPKSPEKPAAKEPAAEKQTAQEIQQRIAAAPAPAVFEGWQLPPLDILDTSPEMQFSQTDNMQRAQLIEETLASYGVEAKVVQINTGPTVTQFGVEPGWDRKYREVKDRDDEGNVHVHLEEVSKTRVKAGRISSLSNDLSLALAAPTIRIEAPVPGKTYVGIEVPNSTFDSVTLRGVLETPGFQKLVNKTKMAIALGKGAGGESVSADLTKMPHLLIAGSTGSGKTVCLNTIICGLLMYNTPNDVRFILIDPKRVELVQYNSIPHLATPVIVETPRALASLRWLCQEMDERYKKFSTVGARNIEAFNKNKEGTGRMPYIVLVIDELADLMMAGFDEVESNLCRLAQLARATGIHLVVATQRPSVDVVTGLIKANFPTRLSFAVTSQIDSRTILDTPGAEKLLGRGDMLYLPTDAAKPKRLQGCYLSDAEIERLVYFWGGQKGDQPDKIRMDAMVGTTPNGTIGGHPRDNLLEQAKELAKNHDDVSTSFLQRKLHIGYPRAARLKEQLDAVLAKEGVKPEPARVEEETEDILDVPLDDDYYKGQD